MPVLGATTGSLCLWLTVAPTSFLCRSRAFWLSTRTTRRRSDRIVSLCNRMDGM